MTPISFSVCKLRFLQRAGFALKRDFFGILPTHVTVETVDQIVELLFADVRRRAAAEVGKPQLPPLKRSACGYTVRSL